MSLPEMACGNRAPHDAHTWDSEYHRFGPYRCHGKGLGRVKPTTVAKMLRQFHETYGVPIRTKPIAQPPESDLRTRLLAEEVQEYYDAVAAGDVVEVADALADIVYVAYGSALSHGIDLDAVIAEVHRSNMSKLGADGKPVLREDGKVIKGPGYFRPDIASVIGATP